MAVLTEMDDEEKNRIQNKDDVLGPIKVKLTESGSPNLVELRSMSLEGRKLWSLRPAICLQHYVLVRKGGDVVQLVVPHSLRQRLFLDMHDHFTTHH